MFRMPFAAAALAAASLGPLAVALTPQAALPAEESASPKEVRQKRRALGLLPASGRRRGKGPQARPKRKRNLVTHSRRVRRRHRRAA